MTAPVRIQVFTRHEKLIAAKREAMLRRRVYPKFVEKGTMTPEEMERGIEVMEAIADDYRKQGQGA